MNSILEPRPSGLPLPTVIQLHHEREFLKQFGGIWHVAAKGFRPPVIYFHMHTGIYCIIISNTVLYRGFECVCFHRFHRTSLAD